MKQKDKIIEEMSKKELKDLISKANKRLIELQKDDYEIIRKEKEDKYQYHLNNCNPEDICCVDCESSVDDCDCCSCTSICSNCNELLNETCQKEKQILEDYKNRLLELKNDK
jgi:hypothetical protein